MEQIHTYATGYIKPKTTSLLYDYIIRINIDGWMRDIDEIDLLPESAPFIHKEPVYESAHFTPKTFQFTEGLDDNEFRHFLIQMVLYKSTYISSVVPIYDTLKYYLEGASVPTQSFIIQSIPDIIEDDLSWEQVIDVRQDKKSIEKLKNFHKWMYKLHGRTEEEIKDELETALEDYKYAIKKHGIRTTTGAATTIFSSTSAFVGAMPNLNHALLSAGIALSGGIIASTVEKKLHLMEQKDVPIVFLYDVLNKR